MRHEYSTRVLALALFAAVTACRSTVVEPVIPAAWTEENAARPLSRADCIDLALHSAPTAAAWTARLAGARANLDQGALLANPTLSLGWEDLGLNAKAAHTPVQTTASLAVALEDVFSRGRRRAAASHDLEAEEASLIAERNRLAAEVARAYDELLAARAKVELLGQLGAIAEGQRAAVTKFVESGLAPRIQLERAVLELATTQSELERARAEERSLELQFAFSLGFDRPMPLQLAEPMTSVARTTTRDLVELLTVAARERPELAEATARYRAQLERAHLASERIQFLPTVLGGLRTTDGALLGVAGFDVVLPVFDSGAVAERTQQAALLAAAADLRRAAQQVARDVHSAALRLSAAEAVLDHSARDLADRRRILRENTERLFVAGEVEYGQLVQARRDEVDARLSLLEAEAGAAFARIDLDAALGVSFAP